MNMFKIIFLQFVIVCSVFGADADGFRDIKWGDIPKKEMTMSKYDATTNIKKYYIQNEKLSVGDAQINAISYWYYDNKFMGVFIQYDKINNFSSLKSTLEAKFGTPYRPNRFMDDYMWMGGNTRVAIYYSKVKDSGTIMIINDEIAKLSDQYKKNNASKAVNDL